jgi:hypothetical protein
VARAHYGAGALAAWPAWAIFCTRLN